MVTDTAARTISAKAPGFNHDMHRIHPFIVHLFVHEYQGQPGIFSTKL